MPTTHDGDTGGPAEFARILGHKNTSQVSRWIKHPPPQWPEPVEWKELPSGRLRPIWRTADMRRFARSDRRPKKGNRTDRGNRGRPASVPTPEEDPRVEAAAAMRERHPEVTDAELIRRIRAEHNFPDHSDTTWYKLVRAAGASRPDAPSRPASVPAPEEDPRVEAAAAMRERHPEVTDAELIRRIRAEHNFPPAHESTWYKLLRTAGASRPDAPVHLPHAKAYPYEGDPRLTVAQQLIAAQPEASDSTLAAELRRTLEDPSSDRTLRKILHIARYIAPSDTTEEKPQ